MHGYITVSSYPQSPQLPTPGRTNSKTPPASRHINNSFSVYLSTVCYYHATYAFYSDDTIYSWLNVKERLTPNRRDIWSLSDSNRIRTHNYLVRKRTLNHLAKQANDWAVVRAYLNGAFDCYVIIMPRTCFRVNPHSIVAAWMSRNSLLKTGTISEVYVTATDWNPQPLSS